MYLKTIADIKQYMLYRPMTPDNRDILFSGSVTTRGHPEKDAKLSADVEHLTCFIGGMVGMSAKIFGLNEDVEIAKKLTDGCVWAYESTASGIMPEGATVYPCESVTDCKWNKTAYYLFLDPMGDRRDLSVQTYIEQKAERQLEEEAALKAAKAKAEAEGTEFGDTRTKDVTIPDLPAGNTTGHDYASTDPSHGTESLRKEHPISLGKRQDSPKKDVPKPITHDFTEDKSLKSGIQQGQAKPKDPMLDAIKTKEKSFQLKADETEAELEDMASSGRQAESLLVEQKPKNNPFNIQDLPPDPLRPLNHTEYVEARIKQNNLPPGFVTLKSRKYILR